MKLFLPWVFCLGLIFMIESDTKPKCKTEIIEGFEIQSCSIELSKEVEETKENL